MVIMLSLSIVTTTSEITSVTVQAAVKAPSIKAKETVLYVGHKTHTISISNLAKGATVTYKSGNAKIATVSKKGVVTPVTAGATTIAVTVKQNKKTYSLKINITVMDPYVAFTESTTYLNVGESFSFKAKAYGTDKKIVWSTSDLDIASVSSSGKVKALKSGSVTIYAEAGKVTSKMELVIGSNRLGTFSKNITIYNDYKIWIDVPESFEGEYLTYDFGKTDVIDCVWDKDWVGDRCALTIKPLAVGMDTITITTNKSNDQLLINVTVVDPPTGRAELNAQDAYEKCGPSTVEIRATLKNGTSTGSGFFVADGMIATNYHVIEGAQKIIVKTTEGENAKEFSINTIVGYDRKLDIAILSINKESDSLVINQDKLKNGQSVFAIGSPFGLTSTITQGIVSSASRDFGDGVSYIQFDAAVSPGNSGGPLVNAYGEVIGIITMQLTEGQNLNFAISISEIQKISTNKPISLAEYQKKYEEEVFEDLLANAVYEDPTISQDPNKCQTVPLDALVIGSLQQGERGDCYYFEITEAGDYKAVIAYESASQMQQVIFFAFDNYDHYVVAESSGGLTEELKAYFYPGGYWVSVIPYQENYTGITVNYVIGIYKSDD